MSEVAIGLTNVKPTDAQLVRLGTLVTHIEGQLDAAITSLITHIEEQIGDLEDEITTLEIQIEELEDEKSDHQCSLWHLEEQLQELTGLVQDNTAK